MCPFFHSHGEEPISWRACVTFRQQGSSDVESLSSSEINIQRCFFFLRHHKRFCCKQTNFVEKLSLFSYFRLFFPDFCLHIAMSPGVFLLPNIDQYNILKTASRKLLHCACASLCVCRKDEDKSWTRLEKHCPEVFLVSSLLVCYCG